MITHGKPRAKLNSQRILKPRKKSFWNILQLKIFSVKWTPKPFQTFLQKHKQHVYTGEK